MNSRMQLRSNPTNVILAKVWLPVLCFGGALGVFGKDLLSWRFVFALPLLAAGLFGASTAILEVRNGVVRYKRLIKWTVIEGEDIAKAGVAWFGFLGFISLRRFIFPWGRLHFALDANLDPNPFHRAHYPLLRYLRKEPVSEEQSLVLGSNSRTAKPRLLLSAATGILTSLMILYLTPSDLLWGDLTKPAPNVPILFKTALQLVALLHSSVVQVAGLAFIAFLAVYRRDRPEAWLYAFLSGFGVVLIVGRLLF
jgi:hypothetical protein